MKGKFVFKKLQSIGLIGGLLIGMIAPLMIATPVYADEGQLGTQQVTLNPGGGILDNGTDGIQRTVL